LPELHFKPASVILSAPAWNILPFPGRSVIVIEQRDDVRRVVSFSAYDFKNDGFLWRDVITREKWWVNLAGVSSNQVLLKVFENTENPDKTSVLCLSMDDGSEIIPDSQQNEGLHTNDTVHPFQYLDGEPDFDTVKNFLKSKMEPAPRLGAEYMEHEGYIIISYYAGAPAAYANLLAIFNSQGECLYHEEIGTNLKGIGLNTFFILSGYLFFVKNRTELVTFRIV